MTEIKDHTDKDHTGPAPHHVKRAYCWQCGEETGQHFAYYDKNNRSIGWVWYCDECGYETA